MNLVSALTHLQAIDQEIDDKSKRALQVDDAIGNDPEVVDARSALDVEQKQLRDLAGDLRNRELEASSLDTKIKELNDQLYGGRVSNPKELDGYAKDVEMHKRNRGKHDDRSLELMDAVDQAQKRVAEKTDALKHVEAKRAGDLDHLFRERESLSARLVELAAEREKTRAALSIDALRLYDRLWQTKAGRAVTQIKRDACGACGVSVPTGIVSHVRTGDEIVVCPSCGRILAP